VPVFLSVLKRLTPQNGSDSRLSRSKTNPVKKGTEYMSNFLNLFITSKCVKFIEKLIFYYESEKVTVFAPNFSPAAGFRTRRSAPHAI
jgi:hypothetical protein